MYTEQIVSVVTGTKFLKRENLWGVKLIIESDNDYQSKKESKNFTWQAFHNFHPMILP